MIISTVDLFCYYNIPGADKEMLFGFKNHPHATKETDTNTALHSFIVYKDCYRVFHDQWVDSGVIQKKFLDKVVVPEIPDLPDNCKRFYYNNIYTEAATYIQQLTGTRFYPKYFNHTTYKEGDVLPELKEKLRTIFKEYNSKLGIENE